MKKKAVWEFVDTTEMATFGAAQGVLNGDLARVDSGGSMRLYAWHQTDTVWYLYPRRSEARGAGSNNAGSANTRIRRWDGTVNTGLAFTYAGSATLGDSWSVGKDGIYAVSVMYTSTPGPAASFLAINNHASLNNAFGGNHVKLRNSFQVATDTLSFSWTGFAAASSKFWISTFTASAGGGTSTLDYEVTLSEWGY